MSRLIPIKLKQIIFFKLLQHWKKGKFVLTPIEVKKFEAEDDWELTEETQKDIEAAWKEHKAGKSIPLAKVMQEYGL